MYFDNFFLSVKCILIFFFKRKMYFDNFYITRKMYFDNFYITRKMYFDNFFLSVKCILIIFYLEVKDNLLATPSTALLIPSISFFALSSNCLGSNAFIKLE